MEEIFSSQAAGLALTGAGAYLKGIFLPAPVASNPPPPVGEQRGAERDRQTAPQQPTHTKLILTRNLR